MAYEVNSFNQNLKIFYPEKGVKALKYQDLENYSKNGADQYFRIARLVVQSQPDVHFCNRIAGKLWDSCELH